jgi:heavy metal sensor kinase
MFRSIRFSLLFWQGLIMSAVIAGFGATMYHNLVRAKRDRIDVKLRESARFVFGSMMPRRHGRPDPRAQDQLAHRFGEGRPDTPYYVIWNPDGSIAARSNPEIRTPFPSEFIFENRDAGGVDRALERGAGDRAFEKGAGDRALAKGAGDRAVERGAGERSNDRGAVDRAPEKVAVEPFAAAGDRRLGSPERPLMRDRGSWREMIIRGPRGMIILVGRSGDDEDRRIREIVGMMLAAGLGALGLAIVGGWFIAGRALAPVDRISEAASDISASNLSRRIDVDKTESELGRLASILNTTFDRLEAAFLRQMRFTADASHELRTPLAIVVSHAELALRKERSASDYRAVIETCLNAARRMENVVEDLLTLARADAGESAIRDEPVDLAETVRETATLLRPLAQSRNVHLSLLVRSVAPYGDKERLRELITNLVTNAIMYNRDGGTATIEVRREGDSAVLRVSDTGVGIAEEDQPHIFERFYRSGTARSRESGGSGLGLAIARWIVDAHHGTIELDSAVDRGSTFTVTIPMAPKTRPKV